MTAIFQNKKLFQDRRQAGRKLALNLLSYAQDDTFVLGLPRGGVPVAEEVARELGAPLDVVLVRKLGMPGNPEYGIGAVAEGNVRILAPEAVNQSFVSAEQLSDISQAEINELERRKIIYRGGRDLPDMKGKTVIIVDDGLATGITAKAAIEAVNLRHPKKIVFAVPVCAMETLEQIKVSTEAVVCLKQLKDLGAVGIWYTDFTQVSDEEVVSILQRSKIETYAKQL